MEKKQATLELGTKPIGKLLMQYALPAIVAMVASSLYNMVDSIFIGQGVGPMAIAGLAITFPFMNLSGAFGAAVGLGSSTLISVFLGQKRYGEAKNILGNNVTLNSIIGITFGIVCLTFLDQILRFFGASDQTLPYAREYMEIILCGNIVTHLYFGMNAVLRAASKPKMAMYATIFTVVLNTILDPLFIYTFGMGIRGAALATILAQLCALCWQFKLLSNKDELLHLHRGIFRLKANLVKRIIGIGISPFLMNACACLVIIFINNALVAYGGDMAVGAYGIGNRISFMFVMICIGINQGMQPIVGYNFGAKKYGRMLKTLTYAIASATVVMICGWTIGEFFPKTVIRLFTTDKELTEAAAHGLRINMLLFPIIGYQIVVTNFFLSIGKAKISAFLSLSRQMLFLIPMLIILPPIYGIDGVWSALPASDALAAIVALVMMAVYMRRFRRMEKDPMNTPAVELSERERIEKEVSKHANRNAAEAPRQVAPWSTNTPRYSSLDS
ncbi:MAG: MATE family efflux transporter [Bacteroidales bacterium]|nr:MATE family efflux transporter [Bacteroidales bacterium]MCM1146332.1 MATE family efflux transporter [Bacteroidales bacterium]MCM1205230.1 MATE family efflux transporter [Bacillota bacterium]MCM1509685.1 MATE family efflux transporter [Clostridium sp.]